MQNILKTKRAPFAVFQPFLCRLITTDIKIPRFDRDVIEVLRFVDIHTTVIAGLTRKPLVFGGFRVKRGMTKDGFVDFVISVDRIGGELRRNAFSLFSKFSTRNQIAIVEFCCQIRFLYCLPQCRHYGRLLFASFLCSFRRLQISFPRR